VEVLGAPISILDSHRGMSLRVTASGTLPIPAGSHRVCISATTTGYAERIDQTVVGPTTFPFLIDACFFKGDAPKQAFLLVAVFDSDEQMVDGDQYIYMLDVKPPIPTIPPRTGTGVSPMLFTGEFLDYAKELDNLPSGVNYIRTGAAWAQLQPTAAHTWASGPIAQQDAFMTACGDRGLPVSITCGTAPVWANGGDSNPLTPAINPAAHGAWMRDLWERYHNVVEILFMDPWNEPNLNSFWSSTDLKYVQTLRAAHAALDGDCPVAIGPLSMADADYLNSLFTTCGLTGADFDWIDLHPYPFKLREVPTGLWTTPLIAPPRIDWEASVVAGIHWIKDTLEAHGCYNVPISCSEFGVSSGPVIQAKPQHRMSETQARDWIAMIFDQAKRIEGLQCISLHEGKDNTAANPDTWGTAWGLLRADYTWRRTREAFQ
jgi:hypothetical protein